jgi:5-oxoprolinase (ATP-hydrolysing)
VVIDNFRLVERGRSAPRTRARSCPPGATPAAMSIRTWPIWRRRLPPTRPASAKCHAMIANFGLDTVLAYMRHVQDNAEASVRRVIGSLRTGLHLPLDDGSEIRVAITVDPDRGEATIDFTGTSPQHPATTTRPRPSRRGRPLRLPHARGPRHPAERGLPQTAAPDPARRLHDQPEYPAAVIAGNTEVSQAITEAPLWARSASSRAARGP